MLAAHQKGPGEGQKIVRRQADESNLSCEGDINSDDSEFASPRQATSDNKYSI